MSSPAVPRARLVSLDALRGFDMFWILGADALVHTLGGLSQSGPMNLLTGQLEHKAWAGFTFYDLIFPLFVFIVGVSIVFSLSQPKTAGDHTARIWRILKRGLLLFLLGILYNGGLAEPWPEVRLVGVLQRIAIAYTVTALLFAYFRPRTLVFVSTVLLVGYWALLAFVPIRDFQLDRAWLTEHLQAAQPTLAQTEAAFNATTSRVTGRFDPGFNLTNHVDFTYLPGGRYDVYYDPEGLLSMLPAIATCLLGVFAGLLLRRSDVPDTKKLLRLTAAGLAALAIGWLWGAQFPVIKKLWTSSFVLVAGGWSLLLLAAFYYVIDIRQWRAWCQPFVWIGMNPITLYLASALFDFRGLARRLVGGSVEAWLNAHVAAGTGALLITLVGLGLVFGLAGLLHQRKIFLRV